MLCILGLFAAGYKSRIEVGREVLVEDWRRDQYRIMM